MQICFILIQCISNISARAFVSLAILRWISQRLNFKRCTCAGYPWIHLEDVQGT